MTSNSAKKPVTVREAATLSGLSVHMVSYLCSSGIIKPKRRRVDSRTAITRGNPRYFEQKDVVLLTLCRYLFERGISVKRIKQNINNLSVNKEGQFSNRYFVTDGKFAKTVDENQVIKEIKTSGSHFIFVVDTKEISNKVYRA